MNKPSIALLCGLLCDKEIWREVKASMDDVADFRVFNFPDFTSIGAMADHVLASMPQRFAVAGHSMGGRVALEIVRRRAERIAGIALLNTGTHPAATHEPASRGKLVALARDRGMEALAAEWLPPLMREAKDAANAVGLRLAAMVKRSSPESFAAQIQALLGRPDASGVLAGVRVPVLLLSGRQDRWLPPAQHTAMRRACPGADLVILEDAGHMAPIEQPMAVASALADWYARVGAAEAARVTLTDVDRFLIGDACTRQINTYARLNDAGDFAAVSRLFTEDGVLIRPANPDQPARGRAEILESFVSRPVRVTLHFVTNVEITVESVARAHASSAILLLGREPAGDLTAIATTAVGRFDDVLKKVGKDWLFAERRGYIVMKNPV